MRRKSNPEAADSGEIVRNIPSGTQDVNIVGGIATLSVDLDNADDDVLVYGFDGTINRKIKTDTNGNLIVDTELPVAVALADGTANPTIPSVGSFLLGWNGATWDRVSVANAGRLQVDVITGGGGGGGTEFDDGDVIDTTSQGTLLMVTDTIPGTAFAMRGNASGIFIQDGGNSITIDAASLPLPTGASTETTLALIKTNTDNLNVALSTISTEATLALIKAKTDNIDVALSTRTKPADTQIVGDGGGSLTVDNSTLSVVGGGVEATALRVTIANDSTGVLSVDDNGGSLTIDGTVTATGANTPSDNFANPVNAVPSQSFLMGWDGATWDRLKTTDVGATATNGILAEGLYAWAGGPESVGSTWVRLHAGNFGADGNSNNFVQLSTADFLLVFNGTTWDRIRSGAFGDDISTATFALGSTKTQTAMYAYDQVAGNYNNVRFARTDGAALGVGTGNDGVLADGVHYSDGAGSWRPARLASGDGFVGSTDIPATAMYGFDGTNFDRLRTVEVGDNALVGLLGTGVYGYDGATWDRVRISSNGSLRVTGADDTPSDTFANTNFAISINTISALMLFDSSGSQWQRLQGFSSDNPNGNRVIGSYEIDNTDGSTTINRVRMSFSQSTTGITTNAAGTAVNMTTTPMSKLAMIVDRTAGATNTVDVRVEASFDGTIFVQVAQITDLTTEPVYISTSDVPSKYMRYNVVTVGAGNTLTIQLLAVR